MFKIYQRHLAATFIPPFLLSTFFFVTFLLTFQLLRLTRIVVNKGVELSAIFSLIGHICMTFIPMALPLAALFATIYTLNKMSEDSEIVAMRSFGASRFNILWPFLAIGMGTALALLSLNMQMIPRSKKIFKNEIIRLTSRGVLADIRAEHFFTEIPGVTLFAEKVSHEGTRMKNVFIFLRDKQKGEERVIFAKDGTLIKHQEEGPGGRSLRMHLEDGNILKSFSDKDEVEKILFKEYDFPILEGAFSLGPMNRDSMLPMGELYGAIKAYGKKISEFSHLKEKDLAKNTAYQKTLQHFYKALLEFWGRFNTPLQVIVFIFLGPSLGIKKGRGRVKNMGAIGLIILIGHYALFFLGVSLSKKGYLHPGITVFVPTFLVFIIARHLYRRLDWMS